MHGFNVIQVVVAAPQVRSLAKVGVLELSMILENTRLGHTIRA
jgi:hypothetical protein